MFIDYVALMLVNLTIALVTLAVFLLWFPEEKTKRTIPGLLLTGFIATATGLHMIFFWPLPGSFNISFGELSVLFGVLLIGAGVALLVGWDFLTLGIYAFFAGLVAVVVGIRIMVLGQTRAPALSGIGYILTGLGGLLALPAYALKGSRAIRYLTILILLGAAVIWAVLGYGAYWDHMDSFSKWQPAPMR